jgi:hypothetical protein
MNLKSEYDVIVGTKDASGILAGLSMGYKAGEFLGAFAVKEGKIPYKATMDRCMETTKGTDPWCMIEEEEKAGDVARQSLFKILGTNEEIDNAWDTITEMAQEVEWISPEPAYGDGFDPADYKFEWCRTENESLTRPERYLNDRMGERCTFGWRGKCNFEQLFDGSGYPRRLRGSDIHQYARIAAIVDIFDAVTAERPHRPALSSFAALEIMHSEMIDGLDHDLFREFVLLLGNQAQYAQLTSASRPFPDNAFPISPGSPASMTSCP